MRSAFRQLALLPALLAGLHGALPVSDPTPTGVAPPTVTPGQDIIVTGTDLLRNGYIAELQYTKKYRATTGEAPTAIVPATSQTATRLVFPAPANMLPTGLALRYHANSKSGTLTFVVTDTSFLSRAPFVIPGRVDVVEPPAEFTSGMGVWISTSPGGQLVSGPFIGPGTVVVTGKNLVPAPSASTVVTFNGTPVSQGAPARYDPNGNGGRGIDVVTLLVSEPATAAVGDLKVTTPGGSNVRANVLMTRRPRVTAVEEINSFGGVIAPSSGRLLRGHRYQIRGTDLGAPAAPPLILGADVRLAGVSLRGNDTTVDASHIRFVVPTTLAPSSGLLEVMPSSGAPPASAGAFSISDPGVVPPPLSDVVVTPSSAVWGSVLTATVAFAGSISAGADVGNIEVTAPGSGDFTGLPIIVPIASNPQTITIRSLVRSSPASRVIRIRLSRFTGVKDSIDKSVQFATPNLTALSLPTASVGGGSTVTATASFDFPPGVQASCGSILFNPPDLRMDVRSSDTSVARIGNLLFGSATGMCVTTNPTSFDVFTNPTTSTRTATITAQLGQVTKSATLTVSAPSLTSVKANRTALTSMQSATGTLMMNAPLSNTPAFLSSSDPSVSVPAKLVLGSFAATNFSITTLPVATARSVIISAAVNGVTQSMSIVLNPLQIAGVGLSPSTVRAGTNAAGTVTLNTTIDLPFTVALSSSDASVVTVPPSLSFVAGQNAGVFSAQTVGPQSVQKLVTITATYSVTLPSGSVVTTSQAATLTVTP